MWEKNWLYSRPPESLCDWEAIQTPIQKEISNIRARMEFLRSEKIISPQVQKTLTQMWEKLMCLWVPETEVDTIYRP